MTIRHLRIPRAGAIDQAQHTRIWLHHTGAPACAKGVSRPAGWDLSPVRAGPPGRVRACGPAGAAARAPVTGARVPA